MFPIQAHAAERHSVYDGVVSLMVVGDYALAIRLPRAMYKSASGISGMSQCSISSRAQPAAPRQ